MLPLWYLVLLRCMVSSQSHAYGYLVLLRLRRLFSVSHLWLSQRYGAATVSHHDLALLATWYCYGAYSYSHAYDSLVLLGVYSRSLLNLTPMVSHTIWIQCHSYWALPTIRPFYGVVYSLADSAYLWCCCGVVYSLAYSALP